MMQRCCLLNSNSCLGQLSLCKSAELNAAVKSLVLVDNCKVIVLFEYKHVLDIVYRQLSKWCGRIGRKMHQKVMQNNIIMQFCIHMDLKQIQTFSPVKTRSKQNAVAAEINYEDEQQVQSSVNNPDMLPVNVDGAADDFVASEVAPVVETFNAFQCQNEVLRRQIREAEDRNNLELLQEENKRLQDKLSVLQMGESGPRSGCSGVLEKERMLLLATVEV